MNNSCQSILQSGPKKGEICGRTHCSYHGEVKDKRFVKVKLLEKAIYVRNVEGSSLDKKNWKKYWLKHTKEEEYPNTCRAKDCEKKAKATGHMYLRDKDEKFNYLIPICSHHNSSKYNEEYFLLKKNVKVVKILEK
jgi:hypothetical protein